MYDETAMRSNHALLNMEEIFDNKERNLFCRLITSLNKKFVFDFNN